MKRYVCTVATGLLLALVSTGTATATGLPLLGQTGTQVTSFGDQTVGEQKNDADVTQAQGNGNLNIAPAVQKQSLDQSSAGCCNPTHRCTPPDPCKPQGGYDRHPKKRCCEHGQSQTGEQKAVFGSQYVGEQRNDADVTQKQGNGNVSLAPAIAFGKGKSGSCYSKCEKSRHPHGGNAETTNAQGNGNDAHATVDQSNSVAQSQAAYQWQSVVDRCKGLVYR